MLKRKNLPRAVVVIALVSGIVARMNLGSPSKT
jgi:hypothetical protein